MSDRYESIAASELWDVPIGRAIALLRSIDKGTTESLSDQELADRARSTLDGPRSSSGSGSSSSGHRSQGSGSGRVAGFR